MPVVFAVMVPNSPLLLPGLVNEVQQSVVKTSRALSKLSKLMSNYQPDLLLLIAEDESVEQNSCALLQASTWPATYREYGDLLSTLTVPGAVGFVHLLKEKLAPTLMVPLRSPRALPAAVAIPLLYLPQTLPIAPLMLPPLASPQLTIDLAHQLADYLQTCQQRIVMVACGLPARQSSLGSDTGKKVFIDALLRNIKAGDYEALMQLDHKLRQATGETLVGPMIVLYHSLPTSQSTTSILSCEPAGPATQLVAQVNW